MRSLMTSPTMTWAVRALAAIEAADALLYLRDAGGLSANGWLVALAAGGVVGAALTWWPRPASRASLAASGIGAVLVAAAPAAAYPLSALLLLAGFARLVASVLPAKRRALA